MKDFCQRQRPRISSTRSRSPSRRTAPAGQACASPAAAATCCGLVKERLVAPDVLVNLKTIKRSRSGDAGGRRHRASAA